MTTNWFDRLAENQHVEGLLLADNQGRILRSSRPLRSDDELIASMFQSMDVLAQALVEEFQYGSVQMLHMSSHNGHLLIFPKFNSHYYLVVIVPRSAPLLLLMIEIERILSELQPEDFASLAAVSPAFYNEPLDAAELIEAVREWLGKRASAQE
jgi:predicted regulator of Ras-like GTPase activity (Roadblock/LC7/MglB family)